MVPAVDTVEGVRAENVKAVALSIPQNLGTPITSGVSSTFTACSLLPQLMNHDCLNNNSLNSSNDRCRNHRSPHSLWSHSLSLLRRSTQTRWSRQASQESSLLVELRKQRLRWRIPTSSHAPLTAKWRILRSSTRSSTSSDDKQSSSKIDNL
jgi:hypothetical protein